MSQFPGQTQDGRYEDDPALKKKATASDFVTELSNRYGAGVEASDIDTLAGKNPEDVEAHKRALDAQYQQRASNLPRGEARNDDQGGQSAAASSPAQAWNSQPADPFPSWYRDLMTQQIAQQQADRAETKARADALYGSLNARATQGLQVNADDPIIKGQVDAFRAENTRASRDYLSDIAEQRGPYSNPRGEQRMASEKVGQGTSAFQAQLLGRELGARRDEIAQALAMQGSLLSGDQQRNLQGQLASLDQAIAEAGIGMQGRSLDLQGDLGFADLALRDRLGMGGLAIQGRGLDQSNDQFLRELALREWDLGNQDEFRWANL